MSQNQKKRWLPFVSVFAVVVVMLASVFIKMEVVREGYELVRLGHFEKRASEEKALLQMSYAKLTRPERLDHIATSKLSMYRALKSQVVLMAAQGGIAIRQ